MRVTMVAAMSANGLISLGTGESERNFTSNEDRTHYRDMLAKAQSVVMGRVTYDAMRQALDLRSGGPLHMVLTSHPHEHKDDAVEDHLEFTDKSAKTVVGQLQDRGYEDILLCGGSKIYTAFLRAGVVNDIYLTLEPQFFGNGTPLLNGELDDMVLTLVEVEPLNETGTLLLHYRTAAE